MLIILRVVMNVQKANTQWGAEILLKAVVLTVTEASTQLSPDRLCVMTVTEASIKTKPVSILV